MGRQPAPQACWALNLSAAPQGLSRLLQLTHSLRAVLLAGVERRERVAVTAAARVVEGRAAVLSRIERPARQLLCAVTHLLRQAAHV